uniref:Uncharacterized protein n=1 Tax=Arundo donax TaxID=35708 RepID=A0A0A9HPK2_ARUDO
MDNAMMHQTPCVSHQRTEAFRQQCGNIEAAEEAKETSKTWQDVPCNIAHHILHQLGSLADTISFASVCHAELRHVSSSHPPGWWLLQRP